MKIKKTNLKFNIKTSKISEEHKESYENVFSNFINRNKILEEDKILFKKAIIELISLHRKINNDYPNTQDLGKYLTKLYKFYTAGLPKESFKLYIKGLLSQTGNKYLIKTRKTKVYNYDDKITIKLEKERNITYVYRNMQETKFKIWKSIYDYYFNKLAKAGYSIDKINSLIPIEPIESYEQYNKQGTMGIFEKAKKEDIIVKSRLVGQPLADFIAVGHEKVYYQQLFRRLLEVFPEMWSKGTIHNDINYGNITVEIIDGVAIPKIIDWAECIRVNNDGYASLWKSLTTKNINDWRRNEQPINILYNLAVLGGLTNGKLKWSKSKIEDYLKKSIKNRLTHNH
ncbi:MAG: hypothetical protein V1824_02565 [archaeon]